MISAYRQQVKAVQKHYSNQGFYTPAYQRQDTPGRTHSALAEDSIMEQVSRPKRSTALRDLRRSVSNDGFSLLELVVAVSIMLILGVVGFTSYQAYTDSARKAALETSASDVLTAVVAADSMPNGDVETAVKSFNDSSDGIVVDVTAANRNGVTVQSMTCDGDSHAITLAGNYEHVPTTAFSGLVYSWEGDPHNSPSTKEVCGEVVARNEAPNPVNAMDRGWRSNRSDFNTAVQATLTDHPLGITTGVKGTVAPESPSNRHSMSIYDTGGMARVQDEFYSGIWVKSDTPGVAYINHANQVQLPANEWKFITNGDKKSGWNNTHQQALMGLFVRHDTAEEAKNATSWATGAVISFDAPVQEYFDGGM